MLDDPLSALDTKVGKHIYQAAIEGLLKDKTCVIVTHQVHHLTAASKVLALSPNGTQLGFAPLQLLLQEMPHLLDIAGMHEESDDSNNSKTNDFDTPTKKELPYASLEVGGKLYEEEERHAGHVSGATYKEYFQAMGSIGFRVLLVIMMFIPQATMIGVDVFLSLWVSFACSIVSQIARLMIWLPVETIRGIPTTMAS